jgi:hypothetical protein
MKMTYTTMEVASIYEVDPRIVTHWIDSRQLRACRMSGSKEVCITHENLLFFSKDHGMPLGESSEEQEKK